MSQPADTRANYCYRHPNRQSFVLCQRCGRTICPECQTPGAVGVFCPECMREQRAATPRVRPQPLRRLTRGDAPVATYALIGVSLLSYLIGILPVVGTTFLNALFFVPILGHSQPWRMVTTLFVYPPTAIFALLINMLTLWLFGRIVEGQIGRARLVALYLVSGLGGSAAVALLGSPTSQALGATASIFGIFGAVMVIQRRLGSNVTGLLILVLLNIAIGFIPGAGFVWQSPLGGVLIGALVGLIYMETRARARRPMQIGLMVALTIVLFAIGIIA